MGPAATMDREGGVREALGRVRSGGSALVARFLRLSPRGRFLALGGGLLGAVVLVSLIGPALALVGAGVAGAGLYAVAQRFARRPGAQPPLSDREVRQMLKSQFRPRVPADGLLLEFNSVAASMFSGLGGALAFGHGQSAMGLALMAMFALLLAALVSVQARGR